MKRRNDSLVLYKRHAPSCAVHKTKLPTEAQRYWFECECPIWIVGRTPDGAVVPRQSTGCYSLKEAEAVRARLAPQTVGEVHPHTIRACVEKYLQSRKHELSDKTLGHHRLLLERLSQYCETRRKPNMRDLTVDLLENFKVDGLPEGMKGTSKATAVAKLRCFLRAAHRRGWITEALVDKVTTYRATYEQKEPYTDEEVERILAEALKMNGGTHGYAGHPKTFRLLLELMLETGMRVGDAVRFDPSALVKGEHLWIYSYSPQKSKRADRRITLEAYISERLKKAIDDCEWLSPAKPFYFGSSKNPAYLANEVYERMQTIGSRCEVPDCRPHRLRDTFAVRKLLAGFTLDDVSRLLGHSSVKVTELYYARWTSSRTRRLEGLIAKSIVNAR